jgi:hypothetical protein
MLFSTDAGSGVPPGLDAGVSGDAGSPSIDASACAPGSVSTFVPVYKPTAPYAGACTADQLDAVMRDCFDPSTNSQRACDAWSSDSGNHDCRSCWSGPVASVPQVTTWAPYVFVANPGQTTYVNVSGCIVLADPTELPCAQTIQNDFACELDACEGNCPVPVAGSSANAVRALDGCFAAANVGGCSVYAEGAKACRKSAAGGASGFCFDAETGDSQALLEYFTLACGVAPAIDAGAGPPDAGNPGLDGGDDRDASVDARDDDTDAE